MSGHGVYALRVPDCPAVVEELAASEVAGKGSQGLLVIDAGLAGVSEAFFYQILVQLT